MEEEGKVKEKFIERVHKEKQVLPEKMKLKDMKEKFLVDQLPTLDVITLNK